MYGLNNGDIIMRKCDVENKVNGFGLWNWMVVVIVVGRLVGGCGELRRCDRKKGANRAPHTRRTYNGGSVTVGPLELSTSPGF